LDGGSLFCDWPNEERIMAGWRRAVELTMSDEEIERLTVLSRSRTEPASQASRAQMLLAYRENPSFCGTGPNWTYGVLDPMPTRAGLAIAQTLIASVYGRWALAD
jgi:hypothetical protein